MKGKILQGLRETEGTISGEAISRRFGVSRVTVWKHIQALRDVGGTDLVRAAAVSIEDDPLEVGSDVRVGMRVLAAGRRWSAIRRPPPHAPAGWTR